jgi:DNA-binding IclR family transcriptional regulator
MHTLEGLGLLSREEPAGPYRLGLEIVGLAGVALAGLDLRRIARPHLISLSGTIGETASVAVWDRGEAVMIDHVPGFEPLRSLGALGRRYPAHCTSPGKVLLAHRPQPEVDQILAGPLPAYTPRTVTDPAALRAELGMIRMRGYAVNMGELNRELAGVSAAIRDHDGDVVAALCLAGPLFRFDKGRMTQLIESIVVAADAVSAEMGAPTMSR